jgi:large subunit ribosomal protein L32e|tara:strand:+ start:881 stop:1306 length:426 start_codon:yes stop_codon:yes gene_type:complete
MSEEEYEPRQKPVLDKQTKKDLSKRNRMSHKRPTFKRQNWFRYKRLGEKWRRPRGIHSKMRRHFKYRIPVAQVGFRGPASVRGLHPSGFEEVLVHNTKEVENVNPETQAVRISSTVGDKKRELIVKKADELKIRVFNRRDL